MRKEILEILEKDARVRAVEIANMIGSTESEVKAEIKAMEEENIICGYNALINWEKTDNNIVTALIEVKVTPQRGNGFDVIAERIYQFPEVKSVYLMSGGFDLTVVIEGKSLKEVAFFVSDKLSTIASVTGTATHFVLKNYKDHGVILEGKKDTDGRMKVSF